MTALPPIISRPPLFARQRQLLQLLEALSGGASKTDFQKLLFLYCQQANRAPPYQFVPYKFGAFSFTSYADASKLSARGLLTEDEHRWQLTDAGRECLRGSRDEAIAQFAEGHRALRGDALVADTYRRFPWFATRSEIAERVLHGETAALARINAAKVMPTSGVIATIGYEGHTLESYLNVLLRAGVTVLCDVRRNPISRKYGFSKGTLGRACVGVGIRYEHLPELGIASDQRRSLETQADYDALFATYERDWLPGQGAALAKIQAWLAAGDSVALTCFEHLPHQCHRHCVAEALEATQGKVVHAKHL